MIKPLAIIPCAGFGTRMNMKPNQSKEMLEDKIYGFKHIIDYSLELCKKYNLEPLVISRKEKKDLNSYLKKKKIKTHIIEVKGEWQETVLSSQKFWRATNILLLPDTRFSPDIKIKEILKGLQLGNNAVFALHEVPDPEKWGIIDDYRIFEKPKQFNFSKMAWGLIGFKKSYGSYLFNTTLSKNIHDCGFVYLNFFEDITRKK